MPNTHGTLSSLFTDIANAIRSKTGGSAQIVADNFPTEIANIPSGGVDPSDATATAGNILYPKTAYISTGKVAGQMTDNGAISVTLDTLTTSYTVPSGYHNGQGSVSVDLQTKSVTPMTSSQVVTPDNGKLLSQISVEAIQTEQKSVTPTGSAQTIIPTSGKFIDSVSVGAVTKTSGIGQTLYNEGVADTKVGTATASDVLNGKTFTNASSVGASGSMTDRGAWTASVTPSSASQTVTIPEGYHNGNGNVTIGASSGTDVTIPTNNVYQVTTSSFDRSNPFDLKNYVENGKFYGVKMASDFISIPQVSRGIIGFIKDGSSHVSPLILTSDGNVYPPSADNSFTIFVADKNNAKLSTTSIASYSFTLYKYNN